MSPCHLLLQVVWFRMRASAKICSLPPSPLHWVAPEGSVGVQRQPGGHPSPLILIQMGNKQVLRSQTLYPRTRGSLERWWGRTASGEKGGVWTPTAMLEGGAHQNTGPGARRASTHLTGCCEDQVEPGQPPCRITWLVISFCRE